jgi:hypothetical protein
MTPASSASSASSEEARVGQEAADREARDQEAAGSQDQETVDPGDSRSASARAGSTHASHVGLHATASSPRILSYTLRRQPEQCPYDTSMWSDNVTQSNKCKRSSYSCT